jgi:hypothetical protein
MEITVSLGPLSHDSGPRRAPVVMSCRFSTWNITMWIWIGCESSVKLLISQISVAPSAGFSVIGISHMSGMPLPKRSTVPSCAAIGAAGTDAGRLHGGADIVGVHADERRLQLVSWFCPLRTTSGRCKLQSSAIHGEAGTMPRARSTATT